MKKEYLIYYRRNILSPEKEEVFINCYTVYSVPVRKERLYSLLRMQVPIYKTEVIVGDEKMINHLKNHIEKSIVSILSGSEKILEDVIDAHNKGNTSPHIHIDQLDKPIPCIRRNSRDHKESAVLTHVISG